MKLKKIILITALSLCATSLIGCSKSDDDSKSKETSEKTEEKAENVDSSSEVTAEKTIEDCSFYIPETFWGGSIKKNETIGATMYSVNKDDFYFTIYADDTDKSSEELIENREEEAKLVFSAVFDENNPKIDKEDIQIVNIGEIKAIYFQKQGKEVVDDIPIRRYDCIFIYNGKEYGIYIQTKDVENDYSEDFMKIVKSIKIKK